MSTGVAAKTAECNANMATGAIHDVGSPSFIAGNRRGHGLSFAMLVFMMIGVQI